MEFGEETEVSSPIIVSFRPTFQASNDRCNDHVVPVFVETQQGKLSFVALLFLGYQPEAHSDYWQPHAHDDLLVVK